MAPIVKPYTWPILFLLPFAASLLNVDLFGDQTLAAYFGYTFFAGGVAVLFVIRSAVLSPAPSPDPSRRLPATTLPTPVLLFLALALFIFLHGMITHTLDLTHYYWAANAVWFWAAWRLRETADTPVIANLYKGVVLLALLESGVVLLQKLGVLASLNPFYTCTGSWENPNVTAMFLSLALYAALQGIRNDRRKPMAWFIPALILLAIVLLQCRTAILVAALFIIGHYWTVLTNFFKSRTPLFKGIMAIAAILVCTTTILLLAFGIKRDSTEGRLRIWKTSIQLIGQRPMTGQGFGRFEKEYNLFTAKESLPDNDHVNMPYNDLLEFGVEGGLGAMALWALFLIVLWKQHRKQGYSVLPILAFLLIQLTNFGFQALPALALFLLYAAIPPERMREGKPVKAPLATGQMIGLGCIGLAALLLSIHQALLAKHFRERTVITKNETGTDAIEAYSELAPYMENFISYHSNFGNAFLKMQQYRPALTQYLKGLETASYPDVMIKCGYCYQQLGLYDSSRYYYSLAENMTPYKFGPHLALLKLYQLQGDQMMMKNEAEEILAMPVKVESSGVEGIKNYARSVLDKMEKEHPGQGEKKEGPNK
jgi:O-antigen polymerase